MQSCLRKALVFAKNIKTIFGENHYYLPHKIYFYLDDSHCQCNYAEIIANVSALVKVVN